MCVLLFFFSLYGDLRDLHVLTHSFPTRRSSDLLGIGGYPKASHPGLLNALDRLPFEFRWSVRYEAMDHLQARGVFAALWRKHDDTSYDWRRSEEHTSELQSLMRISYAVFCLKKKTNTPYRRNLDSTTYNNYTSDITTQPLN